MSFEVRCPQCRLLTQRLGQSTLCLLHVGIVPEGDALDTRAVANAVASVAAEEYDEPYAVGQLHVSVDRPGPFTLREYVRLQLLRIRLQADPSVLKARAEAALLGASLADDPVLNTAGGELPCGMPSVSPPPN